MTSPHATKEAELPKHIGKLASSYNFADFGRDDIQAQDKLPTGKVTVRLEFKSKGMKPGSTISDVADVKLFVNDKEVAQGVVGHAMFRHGVEPFEIGRFTRLRHA